MVYVTSDLHGYPLEKFTALLEKAGFSQNDFLYVLGDVIDRGADGIKILRKLMAMPNAQLIAGNHEAMMLGCSFLFDEITEESIADLTDEKLGSYSNWIANGGEPTLSALRKLGREETEYILEYLREAPIYETVTAGGRDFLLTHSGLGSFEKTKKLSQYSAYDLLWNRPSLNDEYHSGITTVFGHTPTFLFGDEYADKAIFTDTWINIDTGAACGRNPMILRLDDLKEFYF